MSGEFDNKELRKWAFEQTNPSYDTNTRLMAAEMIIRWLCCQEPYQGFMSGDSAK
jgi:hypothetical protein